jgi:hypothetical protein
MKRLSLQSQVPDRTTPFLSPFTFWSIHFFKIDFIIGSLVELNFLFQKNFALTNLIGSELYSTPMSFFATPTAAMASSA